MLEKNTQEKRVDKIWIKPQKHSLRRLVPEEEKMEQKKKEKYTNDDFDDDEDMVMFACVLVRLEALQKIEQ